MAIIDVVKYNGSPDIFAWKYPSQELGTWTQLIVNQSQEAVLYKGGKALDLFTAGRHTLETANIPILNNLVNLPFGGRSPFTAEVWYINKVHSLDIKWGTPTPIQLQDPKYKVFIPLRAYGQFAIQIDDSKVFLTKLVGTLPVFDRDSIVKLFKGIYLTRIKDAISSYLVIKSISVLEINAYLDEISDYLQEKMLPVLAEYGIKLINFMVNDISVPEDDTSVSKLKDALAKRAEMDIVGYSYAQERSFDTLEGAATNPSSGQAGFMGASLGLGMGVGIGGSFGNQMGAMTNTINVNETKKCPKCEATLNVDVKFCSVCGCDTQKKEEEEKDQQQENNSTIICSKCGKVLKPNSKFCAECGTPYNPCPFCSADIPLGATECSICGKSIPQPCPKCSSPTTDTMKFCPVCGESLVKKCVTCGKQIDGFPNFCPECGSKL